MASSCDRCGRRWPPSADVGWSGWTDGHLDTGYMCRQCADELESALEVARRAADAVAIIPPNMAERHATEERHLAAVCNVYEFVYQSWGSPDLEVAADLWMWLLQGPEGHIAEVYGDDDAPMMARLTSMLRERLISRST